MDTIISIILIDAFASELKKKKKSYSRYFVLLIIGIVFGINFLQNYQMILASNIFDMLITFLFSIFLFGSFISLPLYLAFRKKKIN